ncbi:geranylgeranyl pyrophosphate synthase [Undibacterium sp. GrIS 1.2]|uniref:polyprenyl synthetase family protein n=1 Tax=Undibacterium sp. GrIS 1.2 TaxID=3143933 RepID=UPI003392D372
MQANIIEQELIASYLVSKPDALLQQVETCILGLLQSVPNVQLLDRLVISTADSSDIRNAAIYHLQSGGQRLRARMALSAGQEIGLSDQDCIYIAASVELLHNASLIHDDVQDGDKYRRGQESVWNKFSIDLAICSGDFYLSAAYGVLCNISKPSLLPRILQLMHGRVSEAIIGQSAELSISANQFMLETYIQVAMAKSGALLSLPLELTLLIGGHEEMLATAQQACKDFAVGFQIYDDLRDFSVDCAQLNQSLEEDRFNIVGMFNYLNSVSKTCVDSIAASQTLAVKHLRLAQTSLAVLPQQSGKLLAECAQNIERLLDDLLIKN